MLASVSGTLGEEGEEGERGRGRGMERWRGQEGREIFDSSPILLC